MLDLTEALLKAEEEHMSVEKVLEYLLFGKEIKDLDSEEEVYNADSVQG